MKEVAALLGVGLGERFKTSVDGEIDDDLLVFREKGLCYISSDGVERRTPNSVEALLTGEEEIVKLPWRPKKGDVYYYLANLSNVADYNKWTVCRTAWFSDDVDVCRLAMGNRFQTEEDALANKDKVIQRYHDALEVEK